MERTIEAAAPVAAARRADPESLADAVLRRRHQIYNAAYRITGDRERASEATRQALASALRGIESLEADALDVSLMRALTEACRHLLGGGSSRRSRSFPWSPPQGNGRGGTPGGEARGEDEQSERQEQSDRIQAGIGTLPTEERICLILSDVQGLDYAEIARATNTSRRTVRRRLARARAGLRDYLRAQDEPTCSTTTPA